jgi:hypothetical protein
MDLTPALTPEDLLQLHDAVPQSVADLSDPPLRDRVIDAWKNASRLINSIPIWMSYYDSSYPSMYVYQVRTLFRPSRQDYAVECFLESHIAVCFNALKSMNAAIPMIRENEEQSLVGLFPPFPAVGRGKEWERQLRESTKETPQLGSKDVCVIEPIEPRRIARGCEPKLLELRDELIFYLNLLRHAPSQAFGRGMATSTAEGQPREFDIPPSTSESEGGPDILDNPSDPVILRGPDERVIVWGKEKGFLTPAQYRVVEVLVSAKRKNERLSIDMIRNRTQDDGGNVVEDPRGVLKRLRKDPDWAAAIDMADKPGRGYSLRDRPTTSTQKNPVRRPRRPTGP